jgi:hypothetical protein
MRDRASQKPPQPYLGDGASFEREYYESDSVEEKALPVIPIQHSNEPATTNKAEAASRNSVFRFGKSIAASFNPANWKIWAKPQQQPDEETQQEKVLRERREKAAIRYQELKQNGEFMNATRTPGWFNDREKRTAVSIKHESRVSLNQEPGASSKHDSGIEFDPQASSVRRSLETPMEDKRKGRVYLDSLQFQHEFDSAASHEPGSIRKALLSIKKPSLGNIAWSGSDTGSIAPSTGDRQARRVPSRKDFQKQQKLVKRVSDLEGKLESARRQLSQALNEPLPALNASVSTQPPTKIGRNKFVPGALSTLPSERLLQDYLNAEVGFSDDERLSDIGKAVTIDYRKESQVLNLKAMIDDDNPETEARVAPTPTESDRPSKESEIASVEAAAQDIEATEDGTTEPVDNPIAESIQTAQPAKKSKARKRKSKEDDSDIFKLEGAATDSDAESDLHAITTSNDINNNSRPRKIQKICQDADILPSTPDNKKNKVYPRSPATRDFHSKNTAQRHSSHKIVIGTLEKQIIDLGISKLPDAEMKTVIKMLRIELDVVSGSVLSTSNI